MKEGQRRTREGRRDTVYRVSNVTEVRQGEQWKEDTGFSPLSVGTGAEHFLRGVEGPDCSRRKNGWKGTTKAGCAFGVGFAFDLAVRRDWIKSHIFMREGCQ